MAKEQAHVLVRTNEYLKQKLTVSCGFCFGYQLLLSENTLIMDVFSC